MADKVLGFDNSYGMSHLGHNVSSTFAKWILLPYLLALQTNHAQVDHSSICNMLKHTKLHLPCIAVRLHGVKVSPKV